MTVQLVSVSELAQVHAHLGAVRPRAHVRDEVSASVPSSLSVVGGLGAQDPLHGVNQATSVIRSLACDFVRDVAVSGPGYVFHGDRLLTDGSHLSQVAADWVNLPMGDSPVARAPSVQTSVDDLCILATGPGHLIYGHWLVDFMPRVMIAKKALGHDFKSARLILPNDTPRWALTMLQCFAGVEPEQCVFFQRGIEQLAVREACIPTYGHTNYFFHPFCNEVFDGLGESGGGSNRKLCVSRVAYERETHGAAKLFTDRLRFETYAESEGFEVIRPEELSFIDQVALFRSASRVIGEYGSALHSTVFSPAGTKVGFIRCPNPIQMRIGALREQSSVALLPVAHHVAQDGVQVYAADETELTAFFAAMR